MRLFLPSSIFSFRIPLYSLTYSPSSNTSGKNFLHPISASGIGVFTMETCNPPSAEVQLKIPQYLSNSASCSSRPAAWYEISENETVWLQSPSSTSQVPSSNILS